MLVVSGVEEECVGRQQAPALMITRQMPGNPWRSGNAHWLKQCTAPLHTLPRFHLIYRHCCEIGQIQAN